MAKDIGVKIIEKDLLKYGLRVSQWSPGDGWTRHKITDMDGSRDHSQNMTLVELRAWFRGFMFAKGNTGW
ncbi:MAG: hypothetical protein PHW62_00635 [Candidatus Ratteibacteria bacterium]|nr:hypothetical protein [Candidatus Ratteibacteria bacterium]